MKNYMDFMKTTKLAQQMLTEFPDRPQVYLYFRRATGPGTAKVGWLCSFSQPDADDDDFLTLVLCRGKEYQKLLKSTENKRPGGWIHVSKTTPETP